MTTICRSDDLTVPPLVDCCLWNRFCLCFCKSEVISSFRSLRAGSQVFSLPMLFPCVIFHTIWSRKSLPLLCILSFDISCLSTFSNVYAVGYGGLSEIGNCVFRELRSVGFLVVSESPSVLLESWRMLIVVMMGKRSDDSAC